MSEGHTIVTTVHVPPTCTKEFIDWQTKLNAEITAFPGFVSLEIISSIENEKPVWKVVQRFSSSANGSNWSQSQEYQQLIEALKKLVGPQAVQEIESPISNLQSGVTEVFVTQISPEKEHAFRDWIAKMHHIEAQFPGFRGMYLQSPLSKQGFNWLTFLHFDTTEHLDRWLNSPERQKILQESKGLITSLESHRVISAYAGWFSSLETTGRLPSKWKQNMIVLLVLFPIVMLEMKYLSPLTASLHSSVATFISNAISVYLLAWPFVPLAIKGLKWWLVPKADQERTINLLGLLTVLALYLLEILFFWYFY